jgi:hypothetical protein
MFVDMMELSFKQKSVLFFIHIYMCLYISMVLL